jgi:hypothetical protein
MDQDYSTQLHHQTLSNQTHITNLTSHFTHKINTSNQHLSKAHNDLSHQSFNMRLLQSEKDCKSHQMHDILTANQSLLNGQKEEYIQRVILRDGLEKRGYENTVLRSDLVHKSDMINGLRQDLIDSKRDAWE